MLIHYCVIAFKNIWKYKVSASISILGLAFALVCFVPILYWMDHETTYDSFYKDSESIYRVYSAEKQSGKVNKGASKGIENSLREQVLWADRIGSNGIAAGREGGAGWQT